MKKVIIVLLTIMLFTSGLTFWTADVSAAEDYVKIIKIEPDPSIPLQVGSEVNFKATIEYQLDESSAMITLLIQRGDYSKNLDTVVGSTDDILTKGKGTITLEKTIKIPETKVLQIFTPLQLSGQSSTSIVDMKFYKVEK